MIKEYRNTEGLKITEQQAMHMNGNYQEFFFDTNNNLSLKEIVEYNKNEIFQIKYYKKDSENENDIISYLSSKNFYFEIITKNSVGGYVVLTIKGFNTKKGGYLGFHKTVHEITDIQYQYPICSQGYDKQTSQPVVESTIKHYYSIDNYGEKVEGIRFTYKTNGVLNVAVDMRPDYSNHKNWDEYTLANFQELQDLFPWDISYYQNSDLLP